MIKPFVILSVLAAAISSPSQAKDIECRYSKREKCSASGPCEPFTYNGWLNIKSDPATYERCDGKGCDAYPAQVTISGIWHTYQPDGRAMFARVDIDDNFVEVVTLNDIVLIGHGKCKAM